MSEFVELDDGRRVELHRDRGFSSWHSSGDPWDLTIDSIECGVLTTVLPDDAEITGDDHPWEWLALLASLCGINTTADELRTVPYTVEIDEVIRARLHA